MILKFPITMKKILIIFVLFKIAYISSAYSNDIDKVLCKRVLDNGKIIGNMFNYYRGVVWEVQPGHKRPVQHNGKRPGEKRRR